MLAEDREVAGPAAIYQSPTCAWSYAIQICDLIENGADGTYHTAGPESMHRLAYMRALASDFGFDPVLVREKPVRESLIEMLGDPRAAELRVPHNTALCVDKATRTIGGQLGVHDGHCVMRRQLAHRGIEFAGPLQPTKETVA
jgi:dTDP-4-dehydrorhamnose reductase